MIVEAAVKNKLTKACTYLPTYLPSLSCLHYYFFRLSANRPIIRYIWLLHFFSSVNCLTALLQMMIILVDKKYCWIDVKEHLILFHFSQPSDKNGYIFSYSFATGKIFQEIILNIFFHFNHYSNKFVTYVLHRKKITLIEYWELIPVFQWVLLRSNELI